MLLLLQVHQLQSCQEECKRKTLLLSGANKSLKQVAQEKSSMMEQLTSVQALVKEYQGVIEVCVCVLGVGG